MKKLNLALKIIFFSLIGAAATGLIVFLCLNGVEATKVLLNDIWIWFNHPLPIVGVSALVICGMLWTLFSNSSLGKKMLLKVNERIDTTKKEFTAKTEDLDVKYSEAINKIEELKSELEQYKEFFVKVMSKIRNKEVKDLLNETKETINS